MPHSVRFFDRRKFMWDGEAYESPTAAERRNRRTTRPRVSRPSLWRRKEKPSLYTRRVVKEIGLRLSRTEEVAEWRLKSQRNG